MKKQATENILTALNIVYALTDYQAKEGDPHSILLMFDLNDELREYNLNKDIIPLKKHKILIEELNTITTKALKDWSDE